MRKASHDKQRQLAAELEQDLLQLYRSPIIGGADLLRALGYPTDMAFRAALSRNTVPVKVFKLPNRRGKVCLVKDLAVWLASVRIEAAKNFDEETRDKGGDTTTS